MEKEQKASSPEKEEGITGDYKVLNKLGEGAFAKVHLAHHRPTNIPVAVKMVKRGNGSAIENEVLAMKNLDHANIVRLYHVIETKDFTYIVMENSTGGTLWTYVVMSETGMLSEEEAHRIFKQLVLAVEHCHAKGFSHRDIKPTNILLDRKKNVKLCDFGLAIPTTPGKILKSFCGTAIYCAPEMFDGKGYDPQKQDIWSMGLVLYFLVTGYLPFKGGTRSAIKKNILASCNKKDVGLPSTMSSDMVNIVNTLLTINPRRRPTIHEIKNHSWIKFSEESAQPLSTDTLLDSTHHRIAMLMCLMGYNVEELREALQARAYNRVMATYLILKHETPWGDSSYQQAELRIPSGVAIPLESAPTSPHCPGRPSSVPTLPAVSRFAKPYGQRASDESQRLSCPNIPAMQHSPVLHEEVISSGDTNQGLCGSSVPSLSVSSKVTSGYVISSKSQCTKSNAYYTYEDCDSLTAQPPTTRDRSGSYQTLTSYGKKSDESTEIVNTTKTNLSSQHTAPTMTPTLSSQHKPPIMTLTSTSQHPQPTMTVRESLEGNGTRNTPELQRASFHSPLPEGDLLFRNIHTGCRRLRARIIRCWRSLCYCCCAKQTSTVCRNPEAPANGEQSAATDSQG